MVLVTPGKPGCEASQVQRLLLSAHTTNTLYRAAAGSTTALGRGTGQKYIPENLCSSS